MRNWIPILAALFALACNQPKEPVLAAGSVVLALGDSLTAGNGVSREQAWPAILAGQTGWRIINGGVSGDTSAGALERLPHLLDEHTPALVLLAIGGNDMLRRIPEAETVTNLQKIISLSRSRGMRVVLLSTPKPSVAGAVFNHLSAADFYGRVAKEQKLPLIEDALPDVLSDPQLKGDPLHPNLLGHVRLAEKIFIELKRIGIVS